MRVFENRVLRRIFGPKRGEIVGGWRKLHDEKLHNLYSSPNIIRMIKSRRMEWAGHVECMRVEEDECTWIVGEEARKKEPLERPTRRWEDNIKIDLREIGWGGENWINLAQDRDQ
jgi:hypothetical protein